MTQVERKHRGLWPTEHGWRPYLGDNWVVARRTRRIVEKYGESVRCVSSKEYQRLRLVAWDEWERAQ